jgi:hypothetical protein
MDCVYVLMHTHVQEKDTKKKGRRGGRRKEEKRKGMKE